MSVEDQKVLEREQRKEKIYFGGGTKAIEKQKAMGKMTARERIIALLDEGSFHEYDMFVEHDGRDFGMQDKSLPGDGVIIGTGMICGQPIAIFAQDFTVAGGSLGFMHARKITKIMDYALNMRIPLIGINDSGGARIQEAVSYTHLQHLPAYIACGAAFFLAVFFRQLQQPLREKSAFRLDAS